MESRMSAWGGKWQLNDSDAVILVGLFAGVSLHIGSADYSSDKFDPSVAVF